MTELANTLNYQNKHVVNGYYNYVDISPLQALPTISTAEQQIVWQITNQIFNPSKSKFYISGTIPAQAANTNGLMRNDMSMFSRIELYNQNGQFIMQHSFNDYVSRSFYIRNKQKVKQRLEINYYPNDYTITGGQQDPIPRTLGVRFIASGAATALNFCLEYDLKDCFGGFWELNKDIDCGNMTTLQLKCYINPNFFAIGSFGGAAVNYPTAQIPAGNTAVTFSQFKLKLAVQQDVNIIQAIKETTNRGITIPYDYITTQQINLSGTTQTSNFRIAAGAMGHYLKKVLFCTSSDVFFSTLIAGTDQTAGGTPGTVFSYPNNCLIYQKTTAANPAVNVAFVRGPVANNLVGNNSQLLFNEIKVTWNNVQIGDYLISNNEFFKNDKKYLCSLANCYDNFFLCQDFTEMDNYDEKNGGIPLTVDQMIAFQVMNIIFPTNAGVAQYTSMNHYAIIIGTKNLVISNQGLQVV